MKGNIDDDESISSKDTEKKHLDQILVHFSWTIQLLTPFACLLIGVTQEAEGTTLHKEKKHKKAIEATARTKYISHSQKYKLYWKATVLLTFFFK